MRWLAWLAGAFGILVVGASVSAQALVPPDEVVIYIHKDIKDTDFIDGLVCELSRVLAAPVSATTSELSFVGADFATNTQLDAMRVRYSFATTIEGGGRVYRYLVLPYDLKVAGLNYVFASTVRDKLLIGVMSTIRLMPTDSGLTRKRIADVTSDRLYKLILKSVAYLSGLDSEGCIMQFPRSLPELDAKPAEFCPQDHARLVEARLLKARPVGACNVVALTGR